MAINDNTPRGWCAACKTNWTQHHDCPNAISRVATSTPSANSQPTIFGLTWQKLNDAHLKVSAENERLRAEIVDAREWLSAFVAQSSDPGVGALAWLHRNPAPSEKNHTQVGSTYARFHTPDADDAHA